ncbi:MAG: sugar ABC transporter substrate-binding protein [Chloroflexi bacterium]|nr:sugar ABC transporter substrate-binding protein [Chloroflexota bacterium]
MPKYAQNHRTASQTPALSRREFLRQAGIAAAGVFLSSCNLLSNPTPSAEEQTQLVYQDQRDDWFPPMAQEMLEQFHAAHSKTRVFYIPDPADMTDTVLADMQAGTASDVFQGDCTHFPMWAQMGHTLDLRPYVEVDLDQATIDDWDPAQYRAFFTSDGRQFGLPKHHGALALYYNQDLFDKYGVDYPDETWNHDDYLDGMRLLTHDQDGDGQTDLWGSMLDVTWDRIQVHVNGWGGHMVDPDDPTRCLIGEPKALAAMEWLRARMWDDRVMATTLDVQNMSTRQAFIAGRVAMVEDGSWALKDILSGADFRVGVAPLPAGPVRRVTLASTDGFGIYAGTRHPDEAWELVKFLTSPDYGRAMARASFLQPARVSLVDEWVDFVRKEFPEKTRDMDIAAFADGHVKGYSVTAEIFVNMAVAKQATNAAWEEIFILGQAPVDLMKDVCRQIQASQ